MIIVILPSSSSSPVVRLIAWMSWSNAQNRICHSVLAGRIGHSVYACLYASEALYGAACDDFWPHSFFVATTSKNTQVMRRHLKCICNRINAFYSAMRHCLLAIVSFRSINLMGKTQRKKNAMKMTFGVLNQTSHRWMWRTRRTHSLTQSFFVSKNWDEPADVIYFFFFGFSFSMSVG